ncbi:hypothetical protein K7432_004650 [Basidiobolus ranarum]|uniref:Prenylcysteine lyase domain-containing protein n=1 Tax=Basidiobolus ranarum TaxID=34480 RepID=A0ABR2W4A4_9FUNG
MRFDISYFLLGCIFTGSWVSAKHPKVTKKVGIIGAGIGGASTAYFLNELFQQQDVKVDITMFEAEDRVGGRVFSPTFTRPGLPGIPLNMGASLFVSCNYNMMNLTKRFSLPIQEDHGEYFSDSVTNLWNGKGFIWKESPFTRYGPENFVKLQGIIERMLVKFLKIYDSNRIWTSVDGLFKSLQLDNLLKVSGYEYFVSQGLNKTFVREYLDFSTRANYARGITEIHALAACIAAIPTTGVCDTHSVTSGNSALVKELATRSKAKVLLNHRVKAIFNLHGKYVVLSANGRIDTFDSLVVATPFQSAKLFFLPRIRYPSVEYSQVQVTHVTGQLNPSYFNVTEASLPSNIYTTINEGKKTPFNSLYKIANYQPKKGIYMYHLHSTGKLDQSTISRIFSEKRETNVKVVWNAYPRMSTRDVQQKFPVELSSGLYYLNTMEPFISTMETETISAKNIARLIARRIRGSHPAKQ